MLKLFTRLRTWFFILALPPAYHATAQPVISLFSPASGPVGSTVIITGANFNPMPAGNIVSFGNVQAVVTGATANSLTVTVPPGTTYKPISVLNTATGLTAYTSTPFTTTFVNPSGTGISNSYYLPPVGFSIGYASASVAAGDLDGDGKPEMVVGGYYNVSVVRNISIPGSITPYSFATQIFAGNGIANAVSIADLDGDGKPDVVSSHDVSNFLSVLRNTSTPGSLGFEASKDYATGNRPSRAAIGDLDGDGKPDIAVVDNNSSTLSVFRNLSTPGNISFASKLTIATGISPSAVAIADLNGDNKPDLAITIAGASVVTLLRNQAVAGSLAAGSFAAGVDVATTSQPASLEAADLNADGRIDLVMTSSNSNAISVLQNNTPSGYNGFSFSGKIDFAAYDFNRTLTIGDLDGDSRPDIAVQTSLGLGVLRNLTAGGNITSSSFAAKVDFNTGYISSVGAGDLDGDGIPELIATGSISDEYSVFVLRANTPPAATPVPQISVLTPAYGQVGTTVTIAGSNFNAMPAGNIVYFGATRAVISGGSATSLTVTVPAGATYLPVSVLNSSNGLTGFSSQPFAATSNSPGINIGPGYYQPKIDFATGAVPFFATFSDLDGDGKPDLITANAAANTVSLLRNTSSVSLSAPSFGAHTDLPVGNDPRSVATGDLDGDGKPDLVVGNASSGTLSVLRNTSSPGSLGAASFAARTDFIAGANPYSVAIGDVDGDGKLDLVATNFQNGSVSVLRNQSVPGSLDAGSFAAAVNYPAGTYPRFVVVRDLNGDGRPEIAVVNEKSNTVSVLRNTAVAGVLNAASFAAPVSFATGASPGCLAAADLNADGKTDLVVSNFGSNTVSVLSNAAAGNTIDASGFAPKTDYATGLQPFFVAVGNADGDGKPDILVANAGSNSLSVIRNLGGSPGSQMFYPGVEFGAGGYPVCAALADADGDNIPELASVNAGANSISFLKVNNLRARPLITSFNPANGGANTQVTITGTNFSSTPTANYVYFGAIQAQVLSSSPTSLTARVPAGATYQPLSVTFNALTAYASKPFMPTFANPFGTGIPGNFYKPKTDFAASQPFLFAVAFGDLDRDGKPDMVAVNKNTGAVSALRNVSATGSITASSFDAPADYATQAHPEDVRIVDVDGDGLLDIVTVNPGDFSFSVFYNYNFNPGKFTSISFSRPVTVSTGTYFSSLAFGDLDGDGKPDAVATNLYAGSISVLRNIGAGQSGNNLFAARVDFAAGDYPRSVSISDVDGDGRPDIVVANERGNSVSVFRNLTDSYSITPASFAARVDFPAANNPSGVATGDVDGDGKPDIAVSNYSSGTVSVLRNTSTSGSINGASFAARVDFPTGGNPYTVIMGDADGDGKTDLLTANTADNTLSVLRNVATAGAITMSSFAGKVDFATGGYPLSLALGDLDGDGLAEAAAANAATGTISVFKINAPSTVAPATAPATGLAAGEAAATGVQLYPNPTAGAFVLQLSNAKGSAATVEVLDAGGKLVEKRMVNTGGSTVRLPFSLDKQPAGVYYVKVTGVDGVRMLKMVVQR